MKKILLFIVFIAFGLTTHAQKLTLKDVPVTVQDSFSTDYPTIKDAAWTKDGNNYNAGFEEHN